MPIGFTKTFFYKQQQLTADKRSSIDSDELMYGGNSSNSQQSYAEKISVRGLSFKQMNAMYVSNVWVRAIVDKIIERVSDVKPIVKPIRTNTDDSSDFLSDETKRNMDELNEFLLEPNDNNESLTTIRKKLSRDLLIYDAGALEILAGLDISKKKKLVNIYNVPGNTIKINADSRGILPPTDAYVQVDRNLRVVTKWNKEKIIYTMLNPQSDRVYGLSPLESLIQTVTAELYSSQYNLDFFYNNATPRFAVLMEGLGLGQGAAALTRFRTWWDNELRGNPHRPIIIGTEQGKIQFQKVGLNNEEMQFQEYSRMLLAKIMVIYKMQPMILGVDMGNATSNQQNAQVQERQFKIDAIKPHMTMFTEKINQQIIFPKTGFGFKDIYIDFDLDIIDKKQQAEWHQMYLSTGVITINEIRTKGLGMMPVPWGNVPYLQNNLVPFGAGKNGQAVPGNPDDVDTSPVATSNVPNVNLVGKSHLSKYLGAETTAPIGWEQMEISERLEIVEALIKEREHFLSKTYIIP